jgi:hypothetical protein
MLGPLPERYHSVVEAAARGGVAEGRDNAERG